MTYLTNGVLSESENLILDDDYNVDFDEDNDEQKELVKCELIKSRKDSENLDLLNFVADFENINDDKEGREELKNVYY